MASQHTAGPWVRNGCGLIEVPGKFGLTTHTGIACVISDDEMEANERLIAAAPDMLEALREIARLGVNMRGDFSRSAKQSEIARAVIAKAEGR